MDKSNTPVSQSGQARCSIHIVWQSICMNADIGAALPPLCGTPTFAQELEPSTQPTEAEELVSEPVSEPPAESPEEPASTPLEEPEAAPSAEPVILSDDTPAEPNDTVESDTEEPAYSFDVIWGDLEFTYTRNQTQQQSWRITTLTRALHITMKEYPHRVLTIEPTLNQI